MTEALYDQLGGFSAVRKLVSDFYDRVLYDEELAPFFVDVAMADLIDHQTKFWATLLGGPASYTQDQLKRVHATMGIRDRHFDLAMEHVTETLEDHDVAGDDITRVAEALQGYRSSIVQDPSDG
ncbi:MAG: group I truncated hemoglobin [Planctomycetota bacterium]|jgi:hemoglobin